MRLGDDPSPPKLAAGNQLGMLGLGGVALTRFM